MTFVEKLQKIRTRIHVIFRQISNLQERSFKQFIPYRLIIMAPLGSQPPVFPPSICMLSAKMQSDKKG